MKSIVYMVTALVLLMSAACRTTKKINTVISKKDTASTVLADAHADSVRYINEVFRSVEKNTVDFNTFSGKMKVEYWDKDGKGPELTVFVRMKKDSVIWLSINATVFSYEAFRLMITPDSVKLLNKKDKVVQYRSVEYLEEIAQLPFDFNTMQDLIIGNPVFLDSNIVSYKNSGSSITLTSVGNFFKNLMTINKENFLLEHVKLDDINPKRSRTSELNYSGYAPTEGNPFATVRKIVLAEKNRLEVQMEFKQFIFNESLNYPFAVPKNYSVQ